MMNYESYMIPGPKAKGPPGPKGPPEWGEGRHNNKDIQNSFTKTKDLVEQRKTVNAEEMETVKTRTEFPETWLWETIKIK